MPCLSCVQGGVTVENTTARRFPLPSSRNTTLRASIRHWEVPEVEWQGPTSHSEQHMQDRQSNQVITIWDAICFEFTQSDIVIALGAQLPWNSDRINHAGSTRSYLQHSAHHLMSCHLSPVDTKQTTRQSNIISAAQPRKCALSRGSLLPRSIAVRGVCNASQLG
jgi:hypothetical protein